MTRLKSLFGIFVVAAVVYLLWKMMPPYVQAYQFQEELQSISRNNEYSPLDENAIHGEVRKQIAEIDVPVNPEVVGVAKGGRHCIIGVNYTVHVDAMFRPFDMDFHSLSKH